MITLENCRNGLNFSVDFNRDVGLNVEVSYIYGETSPYSNGLKCKEKVFGMNFFKNMLFWHNIDIDHSEYFLLKYYGFYDAQTAIFNEYDYIDETSFVTELMKRTNYNIPLSLVRNTHLYDFVYKLTDYDD